MTLHLTPTYTVKTRLRDSWSYIKRYPERKEGGLFVTKCLSRSNQRHRDDQYCTLPQRPPGVPSIDIILLLY